MMKTIETLSDLLPDEQNANRHTQRGGGMAAASIEECGLGRSIVVDRNGKIIGGHQVTETAAELGLEGVKVVRTDGNTLVVVQREDLDLESEEDDRARKLALYDNRVAEVNLDWSPEEVKAMYDEGMDLSDLWTEEELEELFAELDKDEEEGDADAIPQEAPTRTKPGDLWRLGEHRLFVGDCTQEDAVCALLQGETIQAILTDPPYGIEREGIANDTLESLRSLFDACLARIETENAVCAAFQHTANFQHWLDAIRQAGHTFKRMLWLDKINDECFPWRGWLMKSECILLSEIGDGDWQDVHPYSHDTYRYTGIGKELPKDYEESHPSIKPVEVVSDILKRISPIGGVVYDPFAGSGTTLIACQIHHRAARCMEIIPRYADLILRRYEDYTRETALLVGQY